MSDNACRLYLVSPPAIELASFTGQLTKALEGGDVACFQLRMKGASDAEILLAAEKLVPICQDRDVAFIMNDRPDLALSCGADGLHLGQSDMSMKQARAMLGEAMQIGISCHDSMHLAMEAGEQGADYVAFGAFYPTQSKRPEELAKWGTPTLDMLTVWQTYTTVPSVAIGGITPQNCAPLVKAGADFIAAITAIWQHPKGPGEAVAEFNRAMAAARE